jgi:hypothetical protein
MANVKISQLTPKGANLEPTDLLEISEFDGSGYVTRSITGQEIIDGSGGDFVPYTGAIQDLDLGANELYTGKLWLYDAVNDNYGSTHYTDGNYHIEDADGHKLLVIEDGFMQIHKTDTIQSNLFTSGLTATRDHYLPNASGTIALTSDIVSSITIGTTAITSGTVGRVLFQGAGNVVSQSSKLFWDNTNGRLGIGTSSPNQSLDILTASDATVQARLTNNNSIMSFEQVLDHNRIISINSAQNASKDFVIAGLSVARYVTFKANGNVLIGTTTDAGFKLDVNGTARIQGVIETTQHAYLNNGVWCDVYKNRFGAEVFRITLTSNNMLIGTTTDVASSLVTMSSTTKGFLPPRMTTTQKNAIASPATGLMVYDTTLNLISVYNGTIWISL